MKTSSRNRGVRVSREGIDVLNAAIIKSWESQGKGRKLTRNAQSSLVGLAVATTDKILAGKIVDRTTVLLAFSALGIDLRESFIEPQVNEDKPLKHFQKFKKVWIVSASLLVVVCISVAITRYIQNRNALYFLDTCYERGNTAFQKGDYAEAKRQLALYNANAVSHDSAGRLANAFRLDGDIQGAEGNYRLAKERYESSMSLRQSLREYWYYPGLNEAIGCAEAQMGDLDSAKESFSQSLSGYFATKDMGGVAMAQRGLGTVSFLASDIHRAIEWFDTARHTIRSNGLATINADLDMDISARRDKARAQAGFVSEALKDLQQCLNYWESKKHDRWIASTCLQIAEVQILDQNWFTAEQLAVRSQTLFRVVGDKAGEREAESILEQVQRYENNGDTQSRMNADRANNEKTLD